MKQKSQMVDVAKFHEKINIIFHDIEANYYDKIHNEMWRSLPVQFEMLVNDLDQNNLTTRNIRLLDIGCGTGLSTELLLRTKIRKRISEITLLDTSFTMLQKAKSRSTAWNKQVSFIHGDISVLDESYDLILISSVLHHIPDLSVFFEKVSRLQEKGGIIMTIHDPLSESINSEVYKQRCNAYSKFYAEQLKKRPLVKKVFDKVYLNFSKKPDYIMEVNKKLMQDGITKEPLMPQEIWSVTDIHVEDLPFSKKSGISMVYLQSILNDYKQISTRTYGFFGQAESTLLSEYYQKEQKLILARDQYGRNFSSIWQKNYANENCANNI